MSRLKAKNPKSAEPSKPKGGNRTIRTTDPRYAEGRFRSFLAVREGGCIEFTGNILRSGYGQFTLFNRPQLAHRVAWMITNGPIPEGMLVLHKCDNRSCCNVDHLFLGTQSTNMADCISKGRFRSSEVRKNAPYCIHGHPRTPHNLYVNPTTGGRACIQCQRVHNKKRQEARKAKNGY